MRRWMLLAIMASTLLLAGCIVWSGGGPADDVTPPVSSTSTPTSSPTPTALPSATPLNVQLSWDTYTQVDMDLHLVNKGHGGLAWDLHWDCNYRTCKGAVVGSALDWGVPDGEAGNIDDDPVLDIDNISIAVPENISIAVPTDGTYAVNVHYYASHASSGTDLPTTASILVTGGGMAPFSLSRTLTAQNQLWYAGDINWVGGAATFTTVDTVSITNPAFQFVPGK